VNAFTLEQLYDPSVKALETIEAQVLAGFRPEATEAGVYFRSFDVLEFKEPPDVREQMLRQWAAPKEGRLRIQQAEANREVLILESEARARSIEEIERARFKASGRWVSVIDKLRETLPDIHSDTVAYGLLEIVRDLAGRIGEDEQRAQNLMRNVRLFMQAPVGETRVLRTDVDAPERVTEGRPEIPPRVALPGESEGAEPEQKP
jgi:hypothetical protein